MAQSQHFPSLPNVKDRDTSRYTSSPAFNRT